MHLATSRIQTDDFQSTFVISAILCQNAREINAEKGKFTW